MDKIWVETLNRIKALEGRVAHIELIKNLSPNLPETPEPKPEPEPEPELTEKRE